MSLYILSAHPSMPSALRESLELTGEIVRQAERYSWQQMPAKNALHLPAKQRVDTPAFVICEATPPTGFGYHPNRVLRNKKPLWPHASYAFTQKRELVIHQGSVLKKPSLHQRSNFFNPATISTIHDALTDIMNDVYESDPAP